MSQLDDVRNLLNNLNIGANKVKLGDFILAAIDQAVTAATAANKQGAHVANAAGANPTAEEFEALLDSLREAGIIAEPPESE